MKKRILSTILSLIMILGLLPTVAFAEDGEVESTVIEVSTAEDYVKAYTETIAENTGEWTISLESDITFEGNVSKYKPFEN